MGRTFELCNHFFNDLNDVLKPIEFIEVTKKQKISNVASVFDIEATSFYEGEEKQATMYAWVFGINGRCYRGRTWLDFLMVITKVVKTYNISLDKRFIIYVHNLSYEFQWIQHLFEWESVFSLDSREPVKAITTSGVEFRCSYKLSGLSLAKLGENLTLYPVNKMVGDLDYKLLRHCETPLTDKEWGYILNDGLVVMSYIEEEIVRLNGIDKIPLTKTGYVRNLCRENCFYGANKLPYRRLMRILTMSVEDYQEFKQALLGGFTHANHNHVDKVMRNVSSFDFTSSYPSVMLAEQYPMSKPESLDLITEEQFEFYITHFCCVFTIEFENIHSIVDFEHYISFSRCGNVELPILDNGRIVKAKRLTLTMTEQDFFIIEKMYDWDSMKVGNFKYMRKGYLPKPIITTILDLYKTKTTLKGVKGKEQEYQVGKAMLNSMYGMCVTDPCRDEILFDNEMGWEVQEGDVEALIDKYNESFNRFLYYAWGIWVTAYARRNLFTGILEFGDDYIYSDTDSIKVLNKDKHQKYFEEYNNTISSKIHECLKHYKIPYIRSHPKTIKGVEKPIGVWDYEGDYEMFKTLGAKRYMYVQNGELTITISGVNKAIGAEYLLHKYKTIDKVFKAFKDELEFPPEYVTKDSKGKEVVKSATGKLVHTYLDKEMKGELTDYLGNTASYHEMSGVHLEPTGYNLSLNYLFKQYLLGVKGVFI